MVVLTAATLHLIERLRPERLGTGTIGKLVKRLPPELGAGKPEPDMFPTSAVDTDAGDAGVFSHVYQIATAEPSLLSASVTWT